MNSSLAQKQDGVVLVVSLLLLLVMTILALSMSQTTRLQERMAGNSRDVETAFQAAETGLRGGEDYLASQGGLPTTCADPSSCVVLEQGYFDTTDLTRQDKTWWDQNGQEYGTSSKDLAAVAEDPKYVIEYRGDDKENFSGLTTGKGQERRRTFYEVTARAHGVTDTSEVVSQSVYAVTK